MSSIHGSNSELRIKIRDIRVSHLREGMGVVNYEQWQRNARDSDRPNNGRVTTMVLGEKKDGGVQILQVHETWLSEETVAAGDFDF